MKKNKDYYLEFRIENMDCPSCASMLQITLEESGIKCKCNYSKKSLTIFEEHDYNKIVEIVKNEGYTLNLNE